MTCVSEKNFMDMLSKPLYLCAGFTMNVNNSSKISVKCYPFAHTCCFSQDSGWFEGITLFVNMHIIDYGIYEAALYIAAHLILFYSGFVVARCECKVGFYGADCSKHEICSSYNYNCSKPHVEFCKAQNATTFSCTSVSRILNKYRFADDSWDAMVTGTCNPEKCRYSKCLSVILSHMQLIGPIDVQNFLPISFQYQPISLQYSWLSVEPPIRFWLSFV